MTLKINSGYSLTEPYQFDNLNTRAKTPQAKPNSLQNNSWLPKISAEVTFTALGCNTETKLARAAYMAAASKAGIADVAAQQQFADQMLGSNTANLVLNGKTELDDTSVKSRLLNRDVTFTLSAGKIKALTVFRQQYIEADGAIRFNKKPTVDLRQAQTSDGVTGPTTAAPNTKFRVLLNNDGRPVSGERVLAQYAEDTYRGGNLWGDNYRQIADLSTGQGIRPKITNITRIGNKTSVEFQLTPFDRTVVHENYKTVQEEVNRAVAAYEDFANNNEISSFLRGVFNGALSSVKGTIGLLNLPETFKALRQVVTSPKETFQALCNELGETWEEFKKAPLNKKAEMVGELVGQTIVEILIGKGIGKFGGILAKTKAGAELIEKAKLLKTATGLKLAEAFSDEAAKAASSRLRQKLTTTLYAGIPADALADLTVIAANKIKNGTVRFSEFSKQMIDECGERIKPKLLELYQDSFEKVFGSRKALNLDELLGGHSIDKHIGKSESWLRQRLLDEPFTEAASSYKNYEMANRITGKAIKENSAKIEEWLAGDRSYPLTLKTTAENPVGIILERGKGGSVGLKTARETNKAQVILVKDQTPAGWHVLTSFPSN